MILNQKAEKVFLDIRHVSTFEGRLRDWEFKYKVKKCLSAPLVLAI